MTTKSSYASVHLDVNPSARSAAAVVEPESPFRILLLGDFSGKGAPTGKPTARWNPVEIDRDNFEEVLAGVAPGFPGMHSGKWTISIRTGSTRRASCFRRCAR